MSVFKNLNPLRTKYRVKEWYNAYFEVYVCGIDTLWGWIYEGRYSTLDKAKERIKQLKKPKSNIVHKE